VRATVSDEQLREYFRTFHRVYAEKIEAAIPQKYRGNLLRYGHLTQGVIVYVSTNWGIGYEYDPLRYDGTVELLKTSARVEESMFQVPRGTLDVPGTVMASVHAPRCHFSFCQFAGQLPCRLDSLDASAILNGVRIEFRGKVRVFAFAEMFADRSPVFWSPEQAVERAMDEVLQAAIGVRDMERASIPLGEYLTRYKQRHVLVLGDFGDEGRSRLTDIKDSLYRLGYLPFTLNEVEEVREYDLRHKLAAVAAVCRFVVVDDSSRAGQLAEIPEIEKLRAIMVILRHRGNTSTFVLRALEATSKVIKEVDYDESDLDVRLKESVVWAEDRVKELGERFTDAYPWRKGT